MTLLGQAILEMQCAAQNVQEAYIPISHFFFNKIYRQKITSLVYSAKCFYRRGDILYFCIENLGLFMSREINFGTTIIHHCYYIAGLDVSVRVNIRVQG